MQSTTNVQVEAPAASAPVFQRPSGSGGGNKKGTSAERRATHNAIERARRESLNGRFLQLAASIPAISDVRRPSKSLIVNKSLDFVADAMNREAMYRLKIDNMRQENLQLRQQLNKFLAQAGLEQLPPPPVDELPVPMAEMGNKKRQASLAGSAGLTDLYDLDDDDGPFAAGSEGEGGKTSPTSSCSAASSMRGSLSSSLPSGVPGFTPTVNGNAYGQPTTFLTAPANLAGTNGTSPGASSGSEDIGRERSGGFEDASGNWIQASAFNGQALVSRPVGSAPAAASTQPLTYASLAFSSPDGSNGLMAQAPSSRPDMNGVQQMATSLPLRLDGAPNAGTPNVSGLPTVLAQNGQHQMFAMNANNYLQLRNAQQLQQHQQQQLQYQLQLQQHQQQQHQQQIANLAPFNSSSFFEFAPLQSASFMTAA